MTTIATATVVNARQPCHLLLFCLLLGWLPVSAWAEWHQGGADMMGTRISVGLWHEDAAVAERAIAAVLADMDRIEQAMSPWLPSSGLAQLNARGYPGPVPVSAELMQLIERSQAFSVLTGGAFDVTFRSAGYLYDYRAGVRPDAESLAAAAEAINWQNLVLDPKAGSIRYARPGVLVDLGGIAKGHAVDCSLDLLRRLGITSAVVSAGGDSGFLGQRHNPDGSQGPWMVGIRHPRVAGEMTAVLPMADGAMSTSGDYERFFDDKGVRYHHILDPNTGDSARSSISVTVLGPDATTTDALSTSVFVLGAEAGLALVNRLEGIEAVVVTPDGAQHLSSGLQPQSAEPERQPDSG